MAGLTVMTIVGARPQFVKAAALSRALRLRADPRVTEVLVHTGQHYDSQMSDVFFEELAMPEPDHHLAVGSAPHGRQTGEMMARIEEVVEQRAPDVMLVYGDTNSTMAGALVAAKLHIPVMHVEAGLRSFDRRMPEEVNRVVTDHVSTHLLCPSQLAVDNLAAEGIRDGVRLVGDVMLDVFRLTEASLPAGNEVLDRCGLRPGRFVLTTIHRASNTDGPVFEGVVSGLVSLAAEVAPVLWPVHPRARPLLEGRELPGVHLIEPLSYRQMVALLRDCLAVATDSGGLQKEAYWMGRPTVTLREQTEWPETVAEGWNRILGTGASDLSRELSAAVEACPDPESPRDAYGEARASETIVDLLVSLG